MKLTSTGFWLDFRRVASRRISGNVWSLRLELVLQPLIVALLVFGAFIHRDDVDSYRLNFLYFSTLYVFWIGLFGACQAINSEMKSGEWCYWVLGMGRNRTVHVLAIFASCLLFAFIQCFVFLLAVVILSGVVDMPFNHFVDMFVAVPGGKATVDPIYQMNGALWYVLSAKWGCFGPVIFATSIFGFSLAASLVTGTCFGLLFGAVFREPLTSLNMAVGLIVFFGIVSLCGLQGDGTGKVDALFAPLRDEITVREPMTKREGFDSNAIPVEVVSYVLPLPQRYLFNIGRVTFKKDWSWDNDLQKKLRGRFLGDTDYSKSEKNLSSGIASNMLWRAHWTRDRGAINFETSSGIGLWINGWGRDYPPISERDYFIDWGEPKPYEMVRFLNRHPEHRKGWKVSLYRKILLTTICIEALPLMLMNLLCLTGTLLAVWKKSCYQQLR